MSKTPPGWYPDPEQAQTQRYWDGEHWTDQRAPLPQKRSGIPGVDAKWVASVPILIAVILAIFYFRGSFDGPLSEVGLNWRPCVEIIVSGNKLCGDELEQACREPFFRSANADECREID